MPGAAASSMTPQPPTAGHPMEASPAGSRRRRALLEAGLESRSPLPCRRIPHRRTNMNVRVACYDAVLVVLARQNLRRAVRPGSIASCQAGRESEFNSSVLADSSVSSGGLIRLNRASIARRRRSWWSYRSSLLQDNVRSPRTLPQSVGFQVSQKRRGAAPARAPAPWLTA